jgi:hypothetical protein
MRIWRPIILISLLLMVPCLSHAVDIQYVLSNGNVQSVSNFSIPSIANYGVVTIVGHTSSEIIWPIPSGCSVGALGWSRITDPDNVTISGGGMALRTELVFFKTTSTLLVGCHAVSNWHALKRIRDDALIAGLQEADVAAALNPHNTWYYARCNDAPTNPNCMAWKAQLDIMNAAYPSRVDGIDSATSAAKLVSEASAFKDTQCKANPGGPFC